MYDFTISSAPALPDTGFSPGKITQLPPQPLAKTYAAIRLVLEIPKLGTTASILGIPQSVTS